MGSEGDQKEFLLFSLDVPVQFEFIYHKYTSILKFKKTNEFVNIGIKDGIGPVWPSSPKILYCVIFPLQSRGLWYTASLVSQHLPIAGEGAESSQGREDANWN